MSLPELGQLLYDNGLYLLVNTLVRGVMLAITVAASVTVVALAWEQIEQIRDEIRVPDSHIVLSRSGMRRPYPPRLIRR